MGKNNIRTVIQDSGRRVVARSLALQNSFFDLDLETVLQMSPVELQDTLDNIPHLGAVSRDRLIQLLERTRADLTLQNEVLQETVLGEF